MRNYIYILVACLLWAAPVSAKRDSLAKKIDSLVGIKLKQREDSLQRELLFYKTKESYYNTLLGFQSGAFFTVISVIAAFVGFISWREIHQSIKKNREDYEKELLKLNEVFEKQNQHMLRVEHQLLLEASKLYMSVIPLYEEEEDWDLRLNFALISITYRIESMRMQQNKNYDEVIHNLKNCYSFVQELTKTSTNRESLQNSKTYYYSKLDIISQTNNEDLKNIASLIRAEIHNYCKI